MNNHNQYFENQHFNNQMYSINNVNNNIKKKEIIIIISIIIFVGILLLLFLLKVEKNDENDKYDKIFRQYLENKYHIELNENSIVGNCEDINISDKCDFYGFYMLGEDYNYAIQVIKKDDNYLDSYDIDFYNKRNDLFNYIKQIRNGDFSNYLGFINNTCSGAGLICYSSSEFDKLYYIIKYNDKMNLEDELRKDYEILVKAQEFFEPYKVREMYVHYIKDDKILVKDWIYRLGIDYIGHYSDVMFFPEKYLNNPHYSFRISNYGSDKLLASLTFEEFKELVMSKLETK